jgi:Flp pilus assembly protein CpaB
VATKATTSSTRLLAIGALVLVVGVILVLLVLRGNVGGSPAAAPDPAGDDPADVTAAATTGSESAPAVVPTTVEELASVRLPLPAAVPDGYEGVAVRASFIRGLAAIPTPGDHVNLYRATTGGETEDDGTAGADPVAELVLPDLEVLALIGPLPTQNEGEITFLVAVEPDDVGTLLPVAGSGEVWFTLLPKADADVEDEA